jgi:hypothetical protein
LSDHRSGRERKRLANTPSKKDTRKSPKVKRLTSVEKSNPFIPEKSLYECKRNWLEPI